MTPKEKVPYFLPKRKISDIRDEFLEKLSDYEVCYYVYFIDENEKLIGAISEGELFEAPIDVEAQAVMNPDVTKVSCDTDQESVAILAIDRHLKAVPVVDKENKFLGVVSSRAIFYILQHEHVKDYLKTAGIHSLPAQTLSGSVSFLIRVRIPWLIFGLVGGLASAKLTEFFETPLKQYFILAAFIPLIVYMADAIGTQTQILFIRNLVMRKLNLRKYIFKETKVGLGISLILGILIFFLSYLQSKTFYISLILGLSIFFTGLAAIFVPILIVWLLDKLKKDPAIGSGPFATIIQDVLSLAIYFSISSLLLKIFT